ncbi:MAG: hypothetical protein H7Y42_15935 [Chitinophagaceae bacterium]|nr:hypothetical protein [Chitinophagaceae bacterium]
MISIVRRRSVRVVLLIVLIVFGLTKCIDKNSNKSDAEAISDSPATPQLHAPSYSQFAGGGKCAGCHKDIYEDHKKTGHFLTSRPPDPAYILGSFKEGKNRYDYNPSLVVVMEKRDSGLYQVVYFKGEEKVALPFNMVVGSGTKGQTFVHQKGNRLYQLPISYFSEADQWSNSPGFPSRVLFDRPITTRCLECHATFAETITPPGQEPEEFNDKKIIYGVDCERCHGPAVEHVEFHTANPGEVRGKHIQDPSALTRQQIVDLCALCHGGKMDKIQPSFTFTAGDKLSDFFIPDSLQALAVNLGNVDVHGNQNGLLKASKCYTMSSTLTCVSCHNPHKNERGSLAVFSQRCMGCHSAGHEPICKMTGKLGSSITSNCIDCHMPKQVSRAIALQMPGEDVPRAALIRSHFISIYPDETSKFLRSSEKPLAKPK